MISLYSKTGTSKNYKEKSPSKYIYNFIKDAKLVKRTVFIIGAGGMVGATAAHTLAVKELVSNIVLIDTDYVRANGQSMDISHATAHTKGVHVRIGGYDEIRENDIIVITCGKTMSKHAVTTRLELLDANAGIIKDVVAKIMAQGKKVYIVVVTNPVDIMTSVALGVSGLPKERVFGTGTAIDTARLQVLLADRLHVSPQKVQAYVLGEHGDSSFAALANATVDGVPLAKIPGFKEEVIASLDNTIHTVAHEIVKAKQATYFGISQVIAKIVEGLTQDSSIILPVCSLTAGEYGLRDVVISLPALIDTTGVHILDEYKLSTAEQRLLQRSASIIKQASTAAAKIDVNQASFARKQT